MKHFLFALLITLSAQVNAAFIPTDGTVDLFDLSQLIGGEVDPLFAVIAAGDDPNTAPRIPLNFDPWTGEIVPIVGDQVAFTEVDPGLGGGFAFGNDGAVLVLPSPEFEVVWFNQVDWQLPEVVSQNGPESFQLGFGDNAAVIVSDAGASLVPQAALLVSDVAEVSAVPVPAAAWLFGSGLIGMVGVARRYDG